MGERVPGSEKFSRQKPAAPPDSDFAERRRDSRGPGGPHYNFILLAALCLPCLGAPVVLERGDWMVQLDPATLAAGATLHHDRHVILSRGVLSGQTVSSLAAAKESARWHLDQPQLDVTASLTEEGFRITFRASAPSDVTWPLLNEEPGLDAVVLPRGEGFYVPLREPRWRDFLLDSGGSTTMEELSLPMWGLRYPGLTIAYIMENPFDNRLLWELRGS